MLDTPLQFITILNWTLWTALFIALVYALFTMVAASRRPQGGPALGVVLLTFGLLFCFASGILIYWFSQRQSLTGLVIVAIVLAWPLFPLVAQPISTALKNAKYARSKNTSENLSPS